MKTFSSDKTKIVLVSDIHNDIYKLDKILSKESADINICLGDWWDSFYLDATSDYEKTTEYLINTFMAKENNYTLFGNHDLHYLFVNEFVMCSGYEMRKFEAIENVFKNQRASIRNKFLWCCMVDDILLSHAGLDLRLVSTVKTNADIFAYLDKSIEEANIKIVTDQFHWFYQVGAERGGSFRTGGITWVDFDRELQTIDGLRQIVGHTNQYKKKRIVSHRGDAALNVAEAKDICIDCNLNQYLVIQNGKIEIKNYKDL